MNLWQDAAGILETAAALRDSDPSEIGILVNQSNQLRIVDASGWSLASLKEEYGASVAYAVKRTKGSVTVEAQGPSGQCTLTKSLGKNPLAHWTSGVPRHLIHPETALLAGT